MLRLSVCELVVTCRGVVQEYFILAPCPQAAKVSTMTFPLSFSVILCALAPLREFFFFQSQYGKNTVSPDSCEHDNKFFCHECTTIKTKELTD